MKPGRRQYVHRQAWNAAEYANHASFVPALGAPALALLDPMPGEYILDLGCGDGALTGEIAARGCRVLGIDSSAEMIAAATERGVPACVLNALDLDFVAEFDAVFSNAALHWMPEPARVAHHVHRALKPGGRFVGECGGEGNVASLRDAMVRSFANHPEFGQFESPWYLPTDREYRNILEDAGFRVSSIQLIPRPTALKSGIIPWLQIFTAGITEHLAPAQKDMFHAEVAELARPHIYREDTGWVADYVRLRFVAVKA
jgi:trans-aconitate methyltransferase